ncbi:hypothetical protein [Vallitalea okinawensis]|uniref:hypothetical protein n=1 Tax=Vallitalea okinawensis TaxID=2078660 RepID=UPI000CFCCBC3|nr:hypothetical protein [Vallitalea okinawensis]
MNLYEDYESFILVVIFCISLLGLLAISIKGFHSRKKIQRYKTITYQLMLSAEKKYSFGDKKFIYVVESLYIMLPERIKTKQTKDDVQKWVQQIYNEFRKEYLDNS